MCACLLFVKENIKVRGKGFGRQKIWDWGESKVGLRIMVKRKYFRTNKQKQTSFN